MTIKVTGEIDFSKAAEAAIRAKQLGLFKAMTVANTEQIKRIGSGRGTRGAHFRYKPGYKKLREDRGYSGSFNFRVTGATLKSLKVKVQRVSGRIIGTVFTTNPAVVDRIHGTNKSKPAAQVIAENAARRKTLFGFTKQQLRDIVRELDNSFGGI